VLDKVVRDLYIFSRGKKDEEKKSKRS